MGVVTRLGAWGPRICVLIPAKEKNLSCSPKHPDRLGALPSLVEWVPMEMFPGIMRMSREADHSSLSSAEI